MKNLCLSILPWWAWAIIHANKDVENRTRKDGRVPTVCNHRGPLLVHASSNGTKKAYQEAREWMLRRGVVETIPAFDDLARGGIIGRVRAYDRRLTDSNGHRWQTPRFKLDECRNCGAWVESETAQKPCIAPLMWAMEGTHGMAIDHAEKLPFLPCKGQLGLWEPKCDVPGCADPVRKRPDGRPRPRVATMAFVDPDTKTWRLGCERHARWAPSSFRLLVNLDELPRLRPR